MPNNLFSKDLGTVDVETPVFQRPVDTSNAESISIFKTALEGGLGVHEMGVKEAFTNKILDVGEQEDKFQQEQASLENQLGAAISSEDKKKIDKLSNELFKLEAGKNQGRLTSAEADARRGALLKQAMVANPWLAPELKSIASTFGGVGGRGSSRSATEKMLDKARQDAFENGRTLSKQLEFYSEQGKLAEQTAVNDMAIEEGEATYPAIRNEISSRATLETTNYLNSLAALASKNPTAIDQIKYGDEIAQRKQLMLQAAIRRQAGLAKSGILLTKEQRAEIEADINNAFIPLDGFLKANDKVSYLERVKKLNGLHTYTQFREQFPTLGWLRDAGMGPEAIMNHLVNTHLPAMEEIKTYGPNRLKLRQQLGSEKAAWAMFLLENDAALATKSREQLGAIRDGEVSTNPMDSYLQRALSGSLLQDKEVPEDLQKSSMNVISSHAAGKDFQEMRWFTDPKVRATVNSKPKLVSELSNYLDSHQASIEIRAENNLSNIIPTSQITGSGHYKKLTRGEEITKRADIVFDQQKDQFVAKPNQFSDTRGFPIVNYKDMEDLNLLYKLRKSYNTWGGETIQGWINRIVDRLNRQSPTIGEIQSVTGIDQSLEKIDDSTGGGK